MRKKLVVLTGAGVSAESGLKTFRDSNGLWEGHDVMSVASPQGWERNMKLVLDFYNERRKQLLEVKPNMAHFKLAEIEAFYETIVITQNVDDLHERAGSKKVIHIHGELLSVRSTEDEKLKYRWKEDLKIGDNCKLGYQLRPDIVWFGESVPMLETCIHEISNADIVIIIGTSLQVYPAASLVGYAPSKADVYYVDKNPSSNYELQLQNRLTIIPKTAVEGVPDLVKDLIEKLK